MFLRQKDGNKGQGVPSLSSVTLLETANIKGAFHYARPTGQVPAGLTEENGTTFSNQTGPTEKNGSYNFVPFPSQPHKVKIYFKEVG